MLAPHSALEEHVGVERVEDADVELLHLEEEDKHFVPVVEDTCFVVLLEEDKHFVALVRCVLVEFL